MEVDEVLVAQQWCKYDEKYYPKGSTIKSMVNIS